SPQRQPVNKRQKARLRRRCSSIRNPFYESPVRRKSSKIQIPLSFVEIVTILVTDVNSSHSKRVQEIGRFKRKKLSGPMAARSNYRICRPGYTNRYGDAKN